jgi:hypothetical protein
LEAGPVHAVFDRYHLGERVWPAIFGRKTEYDRPMHRWMAMLLASRGAVQVLPERLWKPGELEEAWANEPTAPAQLPGLVKMFHSAAESLYVPTFVWRLTQTGRYLPAITAVAKSRATVANDIAAITPRWIGVLRPTVLLIGDQVIPSKGWDLPFVPFRNTSGHFLMKTLLETFGVRPAIVNSHGPDGRPEPIHRLRDALGMPPVIALGAVADNRLLETGVPHVKIPHPQYFRRFHNRESDAYAKIIMRAQEAA